MLREVLSAPFDLGDRNVRLSASFGFAIYPFAGEDFTELLKSADTALYRSKRRGRGQITVYSQEIAQEMKRATQSPSPARVIAGGASASVSRSQRTASGNRDCRVRLTPSTSSTARLEVNAVTEAAVGTSTRTVRAPSSRSAMKQACLATSQTVPDPSATTAAGHPAIAARPRSIR